MDSDISASESESEEESDEGTPASENDGTEDEVGVSLGTSGVTTATPGSLATPTDATTTFGAVTMVGGYGSNGKFLAPIDPPDASSIPISTRADLEAIKDNLSGNYHLTADIDLSGAEWVPIGDNVTRSDSSRFTGTFDGQGYTICNMTITGDYQYVGLFGYASRAYIANVGLEVTYINISKDADLYIGGICGYSYFNTISNCYNAGNVSAVSSYADSHAYTGGICGYSNIRNIGNCYNTGDVSTSSPASYAGGICGYSSNGGISNFYSNYNAGNILAYSYSTFSVSYAGGICGSGYTSNNCYNTGDVSANSSGSAYAGGIFASGRDIPYFNSCYNTGDVSVASSGSSYAGGICGYNWNGGSNNCYNMGRVSASSTTSSTSSTSSYVCAGGICGAIVNTQVAIRNSYNTGGVSVSSAVSSNMYIGGISGYIHREMNITNSYCLNLYGSELGTQLTIEQMKIAENFVGYDFENIWDISASINDGYPFLRDMPNGGDIDNPGGGDPVDPGDPNDPITYKPNISVEINGTLTIDALKTPDGFEPQFITFSSHISNLYINLSTPTPEEADKTTAKNTKVSFEFPERVEYKIKDSPDDWKSGLLEYDIGDLENEQSREYLFELRITPQSASETFTITVTVSADNIDDVAKQHVISAGKIIDLALIERVSKYTADVDMSQLESLLAQDLSDTATYNEAVKLYNQAANSHKERWDYARLTTNEMYVAYQFRRYLEGDTWVIGKPRYLLNLDALIFSGDVGDYLTGQWPEKDKYKKMLSKFMTDKKSVDYFEFLGYAGEVESILSASTKVIGIAEKTAVEDILKNLYDCNSIKEIDDLLGKSPILDTVLSDIKSDLSYQSQFAKALGIAGDSIKIAGLTTKGIQDIAQLSSKAEMYLAYEGFLTDIINSGNQLPTAMRAAAIELHDEMNGSYLHVINSIQADIFDFIGGKAIEATKLGSSALFQSVMTGWSIGKLVTNSLLGMSEIIDSAACVEGYSYLAEFYNEKLKDITEDFRNRPTMENAAAFKETYEMLTDLRRAGEEAYLEMCSFNSFWFGFQTQIMRAFTGYYEKESFCSQNINMINSLKFTMDDSRAKKNMTLLPEYDKKVVISCPVDVSIYSKDNKIIGRVINNVVDQSVTTDFENPIIVAVEGESKVIYIPINADYRIEIRATDTGAMSYSLQTIGRNGVENERSNIYNVPLSNGKFLIANPNDEQILDYTTLVIKENGNIIETITPDEILSYSDIGNISI